MGRPKAFENPEQLYGLFQEYLEDILANPIKLEKWVGKGATRVESTHYKPPNWKGFEFFLFKGGYIHNLDWYRRNQNGAYGEYQGIIRAIGAYMFDRKYAGASVGEYQHNIIARELGLADIQEVSNYQRPILENGKELPDDDDLSGLPEDDILA